MNPVTIKTRLTLVTWAAGYPLITGLLVLFEPAVSGWPMPLRILLVSGIMVPVMVFWAMPVINAMRAIDPVRTINSKRTAA